MFRKLARTMLSSTVGICSVVSMTVSEQRLLPAALADSTDFDSPEQSEPFESSGSSSGHSTPPRLPSVSKAESRTASLEPVPSTGGSTSKVDSALRGALDSELDEDPPIRAVAPPAHTAPIRSTVQSAPAAKKSSAIASRATAVKKVATVPREQPEQKGGMLSRIVGSILVVPQSIYHHSINEFHVGLKDLTNDSSNPCLVIPAAMITAPFSVAAGCVEGAASALHLGGESDSESTAATSGTKRVAARKTSASAGQ